MATFLLLAACMHPTSIVVLEPGGHYLITDDYNRAYDCYSKPVGDDWRPTCIRVGYSHEVPPWIRTHYETIGVNNPAAKNGAPDDTTEAAPADGDN